MIGMPAAASRIGPSVGNRPEMQAAALTTAPTRRLTSCSAATRSMSSWSMTAISPG